MMSRGVRAAIRVAVSGLAVLALGTIGYWWIEDVSLFDALYMTSITVTTIGFKETFPLSVVVQPGDVLVTLGPTRALEDVERASH